jgi:hypothetical protein
MDLSMNTSIFMDKFVVRARVLAGGSEPTVL